MSFHLPSLSSDLTPWIDPVLSPQRFITSSERALALHKYSNYLKVRLKLEALFPFLFRIAYLGLRDVDPPEQAVLESLGIASYYVQVIRPMFLKK